MVGDRILKARDRTNSRIARPMAVQKYQRLICVGAREPGGLAVKMLRKQSNVKRVIPAICSPSSLFLSRIINFRSRAENAKVLKTHPITNLRHGTKTLPRSRVLGNIHPALGRRYSGPMWYGEDGLRPAISGPEGQPRGPDW